MSGLSFHGNKKGGFLTFRNLSFLLDSMGYCDKSRLPKLSAQSGWNSSDNRRPPKLSAQSARSASWTNFETSVLLPLIPIGGEFPSKWGNTYISLKHTNISSTNQGHGLCYYFFIVEVKEGRSAYGTM
jgi:hypothetical protein